MRGRGAYTERARRLEEVRERNAQRIEQKPEIVLDNLTRRQSTFTHRDMAREVFRYIDDGERFRNLMARLEGSPELVHLAAAVKDERGNVVEPEQAAGYRVLGGALSGIAAENLQRESGVESRTLTSWEKTWDAGR